MRMFDVINPNPTVEYMIDSKKKGDKYQTVYCPKVKVTFYMDQDSTVALLNILMPLMFCAIGNTMNTVYLRGVADYPDFLANSLALGLTVVFLIPSISSTESLKNEMNSNTFLSLTLFLGLIFGLFSAGLSEDEAPQPVLPFKYFFSIISNIFMYFAVGIMVMNHFQYKSLLNKIASSVPHDESPETFCGRPGKGGKDDKKAKKDKDEKKAAGGHNIKGSDVALGDIQPFYAFKKGDLEVNPNVTGGLDNTDYSKLWKTLESKGELKAVYAGLRKEELLSHFDRKSRNVGKYTKKTAPNGNAKIHTAG